MSKPLTFTVALVVILTAAALIYFTQTKGYSYKPGANADVDIAVNQAKHLYQLAKERGVDFSKGPCLSNALLPGWVVDIAHNPRQAIDDSPENQCSAFREGSATHFVELDPDGNLIRVK